MAQLQLQTVAGPAVVGIVSGGGEVLQLDRLERKATQGLSDNIIMDNIGLIADVGIGGAAVVNHLLPTPVIRQGSEATMGAGICVLTRRATDVVGRNLLGIQRVVTRAPGRNRRRGVNSPSANGQLAAYQPMAAIEGATQVQRRQFFSVT